MDSKIRKTGDAVQGRICAHSTVHSAINQLSAVTGAAKQPGHYRLTIKRVYCVGSDQTN
jgi:hypothetical protein